MGFISWLSGVLGLNSIPISSADWCSDPKIDELYANWQIRELAFESAVNLIANFISKCEFKTKRDGKQVKDREWYLWNVEPNKNQSSSAFIQKIIHELYRKNEALIVSVTNAAQEESLLVADSFTRRQYALYYDVFESVKAGNFTFSKAFTSNEVIYLRLNEGNIKKIVDSVFASYSKLIAYSMDAFRKSRGRRATLQIDNMHGGKEEDINKFFEMMQSRFKAFFDADNAVMPLPNGYKYDELQSKTYSSESTRDIRALIDDVMDFTARGFGIPPVLLRGDVAGINDALDLMLTTCIDPLVDKLQEEINRKRNGYGAMKSGTWLTIDTTAIKHIDILSVAPSIDKLISSGVQSVNDILTLIGQQPIDEDWANKHFITKNYVGLDEAMNAQGGDGDV